MSNVRNFIAAHSGDPKLESELKKIESMDISNIKKLDLIQAAKEEYFKPLITFDTTYRYEDTYMDEMRREYGRFS